MLLFREGFHLASALQQHGGTGCRGSIGMWGDYMGIAPPRIENEMEKQVEKEVETGVL